ncbi:MAG: hypothetical protein WEA04_02820 [Candidatus Andersenbacteria bacterium]
MFEAYWGQALHVARVAARLSQDEVLTELNKRTSRVISLVLLDGMEKDIEEINAETFDAWCELLPQGKTKVLKCAQFLQQNAHRPEQELLEELRRELEYRQWKPQAENQ